MSNNGSGNSNQPNGCQSQSGDSNTQDNSETRAMSLWRVFLITIKGVWKMQKV
jgi:hypothetical protein